MLRQRKNISYQLISRDIPADELKQDQFTLFFSKFEKHYA